MPIYPLTEGLPQRWLRGLIWRTLESKCQVSGVRCQVTSAAPDALHLIPRTAAIRMLHFPEELADAEVARQRLALDEFIELQKQILQRRKNFESRAQALPCGGDNRFIKPFLAALGFKLTEAQTRVLRKIRADLRGRHPMRRLLQGDVGSGKTAVAACTALMALESGFDTALMAPTEILASQHFRNFNRWLEPLGVRVELQTGSRKTVENRESRVEGQPRLRLPTHDPRPSTLFIGTHALIESGFDLPNLGLVIIDEQHKFGVTQREELVRKGRYPHLLVMTATPIPRTLGLTLYGDLDVSVIDELPRGRVPIKTFVRPSDKLPKVWEFIRSGSLKAAYGFIRASKRWHRRTQGVTKEFDNLKTPRACSSVAAWEIEQQGGGSGHGGVSGERRECPAGHRAIEVGVACLTQR